jgi:hypothetical protein
MRLSHRGTPMVFILETKVDRVLTLVKKWDGFPCAYFPAGSNRKEEEWVR